MNLCCCLGKENMQIGDQVWMIEAKKDSPLSLQHVAREAKMIPYEFLVKLERSIRRVVE
jgi:alanine racemase